MKIHKSLWMIITSALYLLVVVIGLFVFESRESLNQYLPYIQLVWIFVCALPLWFRPISRFIDFSNDRNAPWYGVTSETL